MQVSKLNLHYHKTKPKFEHEHLAFKQEKSKFKLKTKPISSFKIQILLGFSLSALIKVVDLSTISNFDFGQFSTSMQEFGEKWVGPLMGQNAIWIFHLVSNFHEF